MNMFKFLTDLFGPHERRALCRGALWAWIAFCPVFGFWAALDAPWAGAISGVLFGSLALVPGLITGLLDDGR